MDLLQRIRSHGQHILLNKNVSPIIECQGLTTIQSRIGLGVKD